MSFITDFEEALAGEARRRGLDGVVCGHPQGRTARRGRHPVLQRWRLGGKPVGAGETHDGQLRLLDWAAIQAEHQAGRQADPSSRKPRSLSLPALPSALRRQGKHP